MIPARTQNCLGCMSPTVHFKRSKYDPTQLLTSCSPKVHFPNGGRVAVVAESLIAMPRSTSSARAAFCTSAPAFGAAIDALHVLTHNDQSTRSTQTFTPEQLLSPGGPAQPELEMEVSAHVHPPTAAVACPHCWGSHSMEHRRTECWRCCHL